ncbi:MAG TPA: NAD(P)-dependent oxidoreductase [Thermoanaerobaculia bacterium]|jgi:nucleoside-diphosphate-sugar epimerase|nr:NAD(P)-dependent oxidoreductase [Thermoanaerobaculia bacterium]
MRIFLAGATGAIGGRLVPLLVAGGYHVIATTRKPEKLERLRAQGAEPVVVDGLDRDAVMKAVLAARPDAIVHQMTALASMRSLKHFDDDFAVTNRLRTEGTSHLLEAARVAGTPRFVAQSYTGWPNERRGGRVKTEEDPLDSHPPKAMTKSLDAIRELEHLVTNSAGITGTVLRYGSLYGPGTSIADQGEIVAMIRQRKFPLVGNGAGVWSFLHVADAARANQLALERDKPGLYNIVDDEPAEVSVWLPYLAEAAGAKPPIPLPVWIARFAVGDAGVSMMTQIRGSSNAKAKRDLGWQPGFASWREGFRQNLTTAGAV